MQRYNYLQIIFYIDTSKFPMIRRIKSAQQLCSYFKKVVYCVVAMMSSEANSDNKWRGVPLSEMYGSQSPWGAPEFPLVSPGHNHAVLYHVPSSGNLGDRPPKPQIGKDKWDNEHVRMPCSSQSLYPVVDVSTNLYSCNVNHLFYSVY